MLFPCMERYPLTHSFGRGKNGKNKINKNNQQKCNADTLLLDTGEMLAAKVQANLQIPSPPPNLQISHPRHMTRPRPHEAATEKRSCEILFVLPL